MDNGYAYADVRAILTEFHLTPHMRGRAEEALALAADPDKRARRWVVERSHSWMNRYRRILVRWDKKADNYLAFCVSPVLSSPFALLGYSDRL